MSLTAIFGTLSFPMYIWVDTVFTFIFDSTWHSIPHDPWQTALKNILLAMSVFSWMFWEWQSLIQIHQENGFKDYYVCA